jgi:hypothetical protein
MSMGKKFHSGYKGLWLKGKIIVSGGPGHVHMCQDSQHNGGLVSDEQGEVKE